MKHGVIGVMAAIMVVGLAGAAFAQPEMKTPPSKCRCAAPAAGEEDVVFKGLVVDAEMTVDASGVAVEPRQATIFRLIRAVKGEVSGPVKVWHVTNPDKCGVTFDYGKEYTVIARKKNNALETDFCLMKDYLRAEGRAAE
jgi:hypothetical protein